jgi:DNA-binding CsgD family transcriptional regulator/DNA-binding phage protein
MLLSESAHSHLSVLDITRIALAAQRAKQPERKISVDKCPCGGAHLTVREVQVLRLAASGLSSIQIGRELGIGRHTVDDHLNEVLRRCDARNRGEAIARAYASGIFVPGHWPPRWSRRKCLDNNNPPMSAQMTAVPASGEECADDEYGDQNAEPALPPGSGTETDSRATPACPDTRPENPRRLVASSADVLVLLKRELPARDGGRRGGRPPVISPDILGLVAAERARGESVTAIARRLQIGRSTLYRALRSHESAR